MSVVLDKILPESRADAMRGAGFWKDQSILDFFDCQVSQAPEKIAIIDTNSVRGERVELSYAELGKMVRKIAWGLTQRGVGRGDVVSMQLPNWWQLTAIHLAAMRLGAITNPLMPIFRERELEFMLRLTESKVLIVPREFRGFDFANMASKLKASIPSIEHILTVGGDRASSFEDMLRQSITEDRDPVLVSTMSHDDVIQILFTSGTTGEPKGVMHTSNTLLSTVRPWTARLGLSSSDIALMASPMAHQTGFLVGLMMPIFLGGSVVLQDIWDARRAAHLIAAEGVTFTMASTPFLVDLANVARTAPHQFRTLRLFMSGGAPIPRTLVHRARESLGAAIISIWGMTENGAVTSTRLDDPPEKSAATDGYPSVGMEIRVVDDLGYVAPTNCEGRLQARGCSNFVGYLKRPEWYAVDAEGWFETGDLARIDDDGYVRITGRSKDVIIRGGENIPVVEIEGLLYQHPAVAEVAIVAMPDPRLGERACAFVVVRDGMLLTLAELTAFLEDRRCSRTYLPEHLEIVAELPKTPSGKIQKFALRDLARRIAEGGDRSDSTPNQTATRVV